MSILKAEKLVKTFGRRRVVDGVSLDVMPGEIVGLLGPNGAGKTTTFRMICGQLKPDQGDVWLSGKNVTQWPMYQRARHGGMGYLPQQSSIFAKLTVQQNLLAMMQLLKMDRKTQKKRCDELLDQFKITKLRKSRAGSLSGGERRRLEIARCLVSEPEIVMLDEPFAGIDPVTVQNIQEVIQELRDSGLSILITDHAAREILQITDRTFVVSEGQILCSGTANEIVQHAEVKRKYLGEIDFVQPNEHDPTASSDTLPAASSNRFASGAPIPLAVPIKTSRKSRGESTMDHNGNQSEANTESPYTIEFDADLPSTIPESFPVIKHHQDGTTKTKPATADSQSGAPLALKKPADKSSDPGTQDIKRPRFSSVRSLDPTDVPAASSEKK